MRYDIWYKINNNITEKKYLKENSYWYKYLNRGPSNYKTFQEEMKKAYHLTPTDKLNKVNENISMVQNFLDILKS